MIGGLNTAPYKNNQKPSFKNAGLVTSALSSPAITNGFRYLQRNPVSEIVGLDVGTMALPRTACDAQQNPVYGAQTFFRETIAIFPNPFMPGIVAGAMMAAKGFKGLRTNSTTLNGLHDAWKKSGAMEYPIGTYAKGSKEAKLQKKAFNNYTDYVLKNTEGKVGKEYKSLAEKDRKVLTEKLFDIAHGNQDKKHVNKQLKLITDEYTNMVGASEDIKVKVGKEGIDTNARMLFRDIIGAGKKVFTVGHDPKKYGGAKGEKLLDAVVTDLEKFSKKRTGWAIGSAMGLGVSLQYLNNLVTKKTTGQSGFTGYKGGATEDVSTEKPAEKKNFWGKKLLASAGILTMSVATTGGFGKKGYFMKKGGFNKLVKKLEIKDQFSHLNVVKMVYGAVLTGRFLASRNETEFKGDVTRDYLGFMNWLVMGPFVAKGIAQMSKTGREHLFNGETRKDGNVFQKAFSWLSDKSLKTPSERLALVKNLEEKAANTVGETEKKGIQKTIKKVTATHNGAMVGGLGYSMFALGIGVPLLINKFIINKSQESKLAQKSDTSDNNIYSSSLNKNSAEKINFNEISKDKEDIFADFYNKKKCLVNNYGNKG